MLRSIGVVLTGYISIGILVVLTDLALSRLFPDTYRFGQAPPDHLLAWHWREAFAVHPLGGG